MTFHQAVGRNIPLNTGHPTHHGHGADMDELVDAEATSDHGPVFNDHVAGHLNRIRHHDSVAQFTVVAQMAIRHQQVVITHNRALSLIGGAVDGDAFPNGVAITDHHFRGSTLVLEILRFQAETSPREHAVVTSQTQPAVQHGIRTNPGVGANHNIGADHSTRPDHNPGCQLGFGIHHRLGMNLHRREIGRHPDQSTRENIS